MRRKLICLVLLILILSLVGCGNIHIGGHNYGEWQVVNEATCTEDGLQERVCSCGDKETEAIPALGHEIVAMEGKAATCTKDGAAEGSRCSRCKQVLQEQQVIPAGHTEVVIPGIAPTCTRAGKEDGSFCSVCGEIVLHQKKIRHGGHDYVNGVCTKCSKLQPDMAAAIVIDQINEKGTPSFYTKRPYPAGSTVTFQVYVPEGASWWAVSWTRNAADAGIYNWVKGDGVRMNLEAGQWQYCTVTLPDDGGKYYIYIVGAKGEWGGKALLIDDVTITSPDGEVLGTDQFTTDVADGLFNAVKSNATSGKTVVYSEEVCAGHWSKTDEAVAETCDQAGKTEGSHCGNCGKILKIQEEIPATGHKWDGENCSVCGKIKENLVATIAIDMLNESAPMNFITKQAYAGGSTVTFKAYVPYGANWWAVSWTTDPADVSLYKWNKDSGAYGQQMISVFGQWAEYSVTLPEGGPYYVYFVGEKGNWNGKELQIDDLLITDSDGAVLAQEDFDNGVNNSIFNVITLNPTNNTVVVGEKVMEELCKNGHTAVIDPAVEPTCTQPGLTKGKHCSVCGLVLVEQQEIPATGHSYGSDDKCACGAVRANRSVAINVDLLSDEKNMNFITRTAYEGGTTLVLRAFVPEGVSWWAVNWTTDPANVGLYKAGAGLGQYMSSQKGQWADYFVTLPNDGNSYYFYIVGAKGEWNEQELLIDDVILVDKLGKTVAEDSFDDGMHSGIFKVTEKDSNNRVVVREAVEADCLHTHKKQETGVTPDCTNAGSLGASTCKDCGTVLHGEIPLPAVGHQWVNGECTVCHEQQTAENHVAAIYIDNITEETASFITKEAYAGGTTVSFKAYVPNKTNWWSVNWTTDPANVGLYKANAGLGQYMTSQKGQWADYSVTLPDDGNSYYIYIVGAKGEWNGKALLIDDVTIGTATEDFEKGLDDCLFDVIKVHGANTIVQWQVAATDRDPCADGHTVVTDPAAEPSCTLPGLTEGSHCSVCELVLVAQEEIPATGHSYGSDGKCECGATRANRSVAINVDLISDADYMNVITRTAYEGGTTLVLRAFVPEGVSWWAVNWTTDPANVGLYKAGAGLGQYMSSQKGQWADYFVTLPNDGNSYYFYIVGAKGEWNEQELLIDDVILVDKLGKTVAEDSFDDGMHSGIFKVTEKDSNNRVVVREAVEADCLHTHKKQETGVTPDCTNAGSLGASTCKDCGTVLHGEIPLPAVGHQWVNGECTVCHEQQTAENHVAAIYIDNITEETASFITKEAYAGGTTVSFKAYVPNKTNWWSVNWTTDPANVGLYKANAGLGQYMTSQKGQWADYSVTLPDDGNSYYIYIVGAKGEWNGKALLIDDVTIGTATEDFEKGLDDCLFDVIKVHGANTIVQWQVAATDRDPCADGHTVVTDPAAEPSCTLPGLTEGSHCSVCELVLVAQEEIPATGHSYGSDGKCECGATRANRSVAINVDLISDADYMNVITRTAYEGGTTLVLRAFVPEGVSWWAVNWTTDPANVGLYKAGAGLGQYMSSQKGQWADYFVTLPNDGNSYYFYIVGAKGEWNEQELLIDDVILVDKLGKTVAEDSFDDGMHSGIFKVTEKDSNNRVVVREAVEADCLHTHKKQETGVTPDCTNAGSLGASTCKDCGTVLHGEIPLPAVGHQWVDGECTVCHEQQSTENHVAAIYIDNITEETASFITKEAYAGGSTVSFQAYVPSGTGWWVVCWTTDPANVGLYKWTSGLGQSMSSQKDQWADYSVTLPDNGNSYYIYIVGAKGEWNGNALLIDNVTVGTATEDFEKGLDDCLFNVVKVHGANTIVQWEIAEVYIPEGPCENGHTEVIDPAVEPSCTESGLTQGSHCSVCGTVIVEQTVVEAAGHQWANGECTVCHKPEDTPDNHVAAIYIDNLTEENASFITKAAYAGGSEVKFQAYVPSGTGWWAVCWTTDPANVGLYKWTSGLGQSMSSQKDQWAEYSVTLPNDGKSYYIYIVGAKGEWNGNALLIDNVTVGTATEDFEKGFEDCLFNVVEIHGANTIVEWKIAEIDSQDDPCENGHTEAIDQAVEPSCTESGLTQGSHCSVCGTVIVEQTVVEAAGHQWANGECSVCHEPQPANENHLAAIYIDNLTETTPMSFITKEAYAGGTEIKFQAYVPTGASWWAVSWTTDPTNVGLYKWTAGLGKNMKSSSVYDAWAEYSVTLPNDGNSYYVYIVGAKGEWGGNALLIDDVTVGTVTEDFENGFEDSLFSVVETHGVNTVVEWQTIEDESQEESAESYVAAIYIDNLTETTPMSFITKEAYAGGTEIKFQAYVPTGASWWAVSWTTDPTNVGLYKWTAGLGKNMKSSSVYDAWAEYSVTLPNDGNSYYVYIVGAKGEWGGKALLIDDVTVGSATEDFENGFENSLFTVVETHGANTIVELKRKEDSEDQ